MTDRDFRTAILLLLGSALLLIWLGRCTDVDIVLADAMFDFSKNAFPLRDRWFLDEFMHQTMKALMIGIGMVPAAALIADRINGHMLLENSVRRSLVVVVTSAALVPILISAIKSVSPYHCPWSLTRYGGYAPYLRIFDSLPPRMSSGHCFPAGHASSALWLPSIAVFWLPEHPVKGYTVFAASLVPGFVLGFAQQARGAHFMTHTLWSAWIAILVVVLLLRLESLVRK
ncbi:phosphatase PAP2 family protein [Noviherbaspirillum aerium]|uniref:phosphatase PAP2 family protein n=1 Tax=Noviherbaspirillum aerium TaxID=2588497 RepID=UPI00124D8242|nr:phosphatase PAP2 family protein [Noviherbaspirillum aerium]